MTERPSPDSGSSGRDASPRRANVLAILVIILAVLGVLLWKQGGSGSSPTGAGGASAETTAEGTRAARLGKIVSGLGAAWDARDEKRFVDTAGTSAESRAWAKQTYDNLRDLDVADFQARFVAEDSRGLQPDGTFAADVTVSWKPAKSSALASSRTRPVTVKMVFRPSEAGYDVEAVRAADDPVPLWLAGDLRVERKGRTNLVYLGALGQGRLAPKSLTKMSRHARRALHDVVGHKVGPSSVVIPNTSTQTAALVGQNGLGQIAAVTTTVDGSTNGAVGTYVVLNPDVFSGLGRRAAQIVLTHEVTHALTGATAGRMPLWVAEGFADYIALHDDGLSVRKSASQILKRVRAKGTPKDLPDAKDFGAAQHGLGATYESAWLVFELLHLRAGDETIVDFYTDVRDGASVEKALETHFGLGVDTLTDLWRDYLTGLARR